MKASKQVGLRRYRQSRKGRVMTLTYRPSPDGGRVLSAPPPRHSLFGRLFRRHRDEQIRHAMPWLVASGAIVPGSVYRRK